MDNKNTCAICKIRAYIQCDMCQKPLFFCSRGHLHTHKLRSHKTGKIEHRPTIENDQNSNDIDLRKLFEYIQNLKREIDSNMNQENHVEAIMLINKCLPLSKRFYQEDHIFVK